MFPAFPNTTHVHHHHHAHHHHTNNDDVDDDDTDEDRDCNESDCSYAGLCSGWRADGSPVCVCNLNVGGDRCQLGPGTNSVPSNTNTGTSGCPECNYHGNCVFANNGQTNTNGAPITDPTPTTNGQQLRCQCFAGYSGSNCQTGGPRMARIRWRINTGALG